MNKEESLKKYLEVTPIVEQTKGLSYYSFQVPSDSNGEYWNYDMIIRPKWSNPTISRYDILDSNRTKPFASGGKGKIYLTFATIKPEKSNFLTFHRSRKITKIEKHSHDEIFSNIEDESNILRAKGDFKIKKPVFVEIDSIKYSFLTMRNIPGLPLDVVLDAKTELSIEDIYQYFFSLCLDIQDSHRKGFLHGDIKPANIIVSPQNKSAKLIDYNDASYLQCPGKLGTPNYMAPEMITGEAMTTASEVYSLGINLGRLCGVPERENRVEALKQTEGQSAEDFENKQLTGLLYELEIFQDYFRENAIKKLTLLLAEKKEISPLEAEIILHIYSRAICSDPALRLDLDTCIDYVSFLQLYHLQCKLADSLDNTNINPDMIDQLKSFFTEESIETFSSNQILELADELESIVEGLEFLRGVLPETDAGFDKLMLLFALPSKTKLKDLLIKVDAVRQILNDLVLIWEKTFDLPDHTKRLSDLERICDSIKELILLDFNRNKITEAATLINCMQLSQNEVERRLIAFRGSMDTEISIQEAKHKKLSRVNTQVFVQITPVSSEEAGCLTGASSKDYQVIHTVGTTEFLGITPSLSIQKVPSVSSVPSKDYQVIYRTGTTEFLALSPSQLNKKSPKIATIKKASDASSLLNWFKEINHEDADQLKIGSPNFKRNMNF